MSQINKQSKLNQFEQFELPAKKQDEVKGGQGQMGSGLQQQGGAPMQNGQGQILGKPGQPVMGTGMPGGLQNGNQNGGQQVGNIGGRQGNMVVQTGLSFDPRPMK